MLQRSPEAFQTPSPLIPRPPSPNQRAPKKELPMTSSTRGKPSVENPKLDDQAAQEMKMKVEAAKEAVKNLKSGMSKEGAAAKASAGRGRGRGKGKGKGKGAGKGKGKKDSDKAASSKGGRKTTQTKGSSRTKMPKKSEEKKEEEMEIEEMEGEEEEFDEDEDPEVQQVNSDEDSMDAPTLNMSPSTWKKESAKQRAEMARKKPAAAKAKSSFQDFKKQFPWNKQNADATPKAKSKTRKAGPGFLLFQYI